jgi:ubiquinone/menaquinone biosynthesis C-methylase UbiE
VGEMVFSMDSDLRKTMLTFFSERNTKNALMPKWTLLEHNERYWLANQFTKGKTVLDCACGSGIGSQIYIQSGAKEIISLDISDTAIREAEKSNKSPMVKFAQASALALPIKSSSIDVYISFETIEHVINDEPYLKEAIRVLRPGGTFICSTPNRNVTNPGSRLGQHPINPYHIREYSDEEFLQLLSRHFEIFEIHGQNKKPAITINITNRLSSFIPHPVPARIHQLFKIILYFLGLSHKDGIQAIPCSQGSRYEFLTAICKKPHP